MSLRKKFLLKNCSTFFLTGNSVLRYNLNNAEEAGYFMAVGGGGGD